MLFTSGTTGAPTPIVHHHAAYLEIIDRVLGPLSQHRDPSKRPSPNLVPVPMALNAGIYNALFGLRAGAPLVLMDRFTTGDFARLVAEHGIRSTVLPPASIAMLNDDAEITELGPLRYVRSITAPLSPFQARRFRDAFGVFVLNGYGQAELGEVVGWTAADAKAHPDRVGAAGRPHPGVEVRIETPDEAGVGELLVQPPRPPAAGVAATLGDRLGADGFVRTGDLARIDEEGFVWIEGRAGDLINRGGNKVFPDEVEEVLASVDGIVEAAVVGRPDDRLGQVPVAFVVGDAADDEMEAACRAHLAPYKVPVHFERVDTLPRNRRRQAATARSCSPADSRRLPRPGVVALAGDLPRHLIDHHQPARHLVARQVCTAVVGELGERRCRGPFGQRHHGGDGGAEALVGHAHHERVEHGGMALDRGLHLLGEEPSPHPC